MQGEATQLDMTTPPPCRNDTLHTFTELEQKIRIRNLLQKIVEEQLTAFRRLLAQLAVVIVQRF
jgi:hypothetical protein